MAYWGQAPTPPRPRELWQAMKTRLDTARMQSVLGGADRIALITDEMRPIGAETEAWGRVVIAPVRRMYGEMQDQPGRRRVAPFLVRTEVHSPGGGYDPSIALEAAQNEAFARLHGWTPGAYTHVRVDRALWRETVPQTLPMWDDDSGLWFLSAEYRAYLSPV